MSLITVKEAALKLGISEMTLYQQKKRNVLFGQYFEEHEGHLMADEHKLELFARAYGSPAKRAEYSRDTKIGVRFNDVELARLKANAGEKPLATYIRDRVL